MTMMQLLFLIVAAISLISAVMVVTNRNLVHSALWLIVTLFTVAIIFVLLNAGFFAVVQVVIYIGAIAILFIFAVMLTRNIMADSGPQTSKVWPLAAFLSVVLFVAIFLGLNSWPGFTSVAPALEDETTIIRDLGLALVSPDGYVIPFEVASVLLVAAMMGAIYVAWGKK